jgi:glutamate synthase domain-containing protein 2
MRCLSQENRLPSRCGPGKIPLNKDEFVDTKTVIGPGAKVPLVTETPIFITHISFGALSKEAKTAIAKGSAAVKTAIGSGEGGILPEEIDHWGHNG